MFDTTQSFDAACSCKKAGQSWADALGKDEAIEAGDIVVTEDRAKQLSQPPAPAQKGQPKGRAPAAPGAPAAAGTPPVQAETPPATPPAAEPGGQEDDPRGRPDVHSGKVKRRPGDSQIHSFHGGNRGSSPGEARASYARARYGTTALPLLRQRLLAARAAAPLDVLREAL